MSLSDLHEAIQAKDVDRAWAIASALPHVPLRFAARLVRLLIEELDPRWEPAARRFMVRVLEEVDADRASLLEFKRLADILAHVFHHYHRHEARAGLDSVVGQMHERDRRLALEFDSLGEDRPWR